MISLDLQLRQVRHTPSLCKELHVLLITIQFILNIPTRTEAACMFQCTIIIMQ